MVEKFLKHIKEKKMLSPDSKIIMAVSGGIDSMVMAHLFQNLNNKTAVAHCNFCLRDSESDKDEELVSNYAEAHKLPFFHIRFRTKEYAGEKGISVQMAARELRYDWFESIRAENNYDLISLAHNLNDNIETMIINLIRGTGLTGLRGMKPVSNRLIRPLLFASREEIGNYCSEYGIPFREDLSNAETKYTRNKIRHLVIPILREINPAVEKTLSETAGRLAETEELLSEIVSNIISATSTGRGTDRVFSIEKLGEYRKNRSVLFEIFSKYGLPGSSTGDLARLISGSTGRHIITRTHRILRNRGELIVTPVRTLQTEDHFVNDIDTLSKVPGIKSAEIRSRKPGFRISRSRNTACIDFDKITFPLMIRHWQKGDAFYPLGMTKRKKISDYFTDRKFSLIRKENARLLESDGKIVWIMGERLDNRFRITKETVKILLIRLLPGRS